MPSSGNHSDRRPAMTSAGTLIISIGSQYSYHVRSVNNLANQVWWQSSLVLVDLLLLLPLLYLDVVLGTGRKHPSTRPTGAHWEGGVGSKYGYLGSRFYEKR
ncbi:alpha beta hydrolase fold protein [Diaporthe amygdali]|uniref:alpha beta hydrolase fold protein n=1 Tax=Phomopsis amygdali TaxID=1214568 RepID=UPI0022FEC00B|nr:alpha beta hydrolase fold protein [Diaporthe amygdali]KAJ0118763.1 alpha beta hydrolase fold protein [Diaporthe amygdali]